MRVIFCSEPFSPSKIDPSYQQEFLAAQEAGFDCDLIDFELLVEEGKPKSSVRRVNDADENIIAIFRGWMMKPNQYAELYDSLREKGVHLINTPLQYKHCHYLPESYSIIEKHTPNTVWMKVDADFNLSDLMKLLEVFGDRPLILKDFVKSRKHEWLEACFIPCASDQQRVERTVTRFLELQGDHLNEGLVFREFVEFESLTTHTKSGTPLSKEYRLFFLDGRLLSLLSYWEEGNYQTDEVPSDLFADVAKKVESRFFTMDVAKRKDGNWIIVELGDAQVAGLPEQANPPIFYTALMSRLEVQ